MQPLLIASFGTHDGGLIRKVHMSGCWKIMASSNTVDNLIHQAAKTSSLTGVCLKSCCDDQWMTLTLATLTWHFKSSIQA